jgi:hypothetical protein
MREKYFKFLQEHNLRDWLEELDDYPYSKKLKLLEDNFFRCSKNSLEMALYEYFNNYILLERVNYKIIDKIIKGLVDKYYEKLK